MSKAHPGFKSVQKKIEGEGYSKESAGAILASKTRGASAAAKKANPRLRRVKAAHNPSPPYPSMMGEYDAMPHHGVHHAKHMPDHGKGDGVPKKLKGIFDHGDTDHPSSL